MKRPPHFVVRKGFYYGQPMWIAYHWYAPLQRWTPSLVHWNWRAVMNMIDYELRLRWVSDRRAPEEPRAVDR